MCEVFGDHINRSETKHMLRRDIAATSLKILSKNHDSIKCYDKTNIEICTLSMRKIFSWGLIYIGQFT